MTKLQRLVKRKAHRARNSMMRDTFRLFREECARQITAVREVERLYKESKLVVNSDG